MDLKADSPQYGMLTYPEKVAMFYIAVQKCETPYHELIGKIKKAAKAEFPVLRGNAIQMLYMAGTNLRQLIKVAHSDYGFEDQLQLRQWDYHFVLIQPNFEVYQKAKEIRKTIETITQKELDRFEMIVKESYRRVHELQIWGEALAAVLTSLQNCAISTIQETYRYLSFLSAEQYLKIPSYERKRLLNLTKRISVDFADVIQLGVKKRKAKDEGKSSKKSKTKSAGRD
jgi:hypothetical protein